MTHLKNKTASTLLAALLAVAPVATFASESGSPQQAVTADPDEAVEATDSDKKVYGSTETGSPQQSVKTDEDETVVENGDIEGSMIEDDAKSDG